MFVDVFEKLCEENRIAPSRVLDNLGITRSAYSRWSKGGSLSNETKMSGETKKPLPLRQRPVMKCRKYCAGGYRKRSGKPLDFKLERTRYIFVGGVFGVVIYR